MLLFTVHVFIEEIDETTKRFRTQHREGGASLVKGGKADSTNEGYQRHWKEWLIFLQMWHGRVNPLAGDGFLGGIILNQKVAIVLGFVSYLHSDKGFNGQGIASHLSGVRSAFIDEGEESEWFLDLRISRVKAGCLKRDALEGRESESKLPLPKVVFEAMVATAQQEGTTKANGLEIGLVLAMVCLLRCSEFTSGKAKHTIRAENIEFWLSRSQRYCLSSQVHLLTGAERNEIIEVRITIPSSKTDRMGAGYRITFDASSGMPEIPLLQKLLQWSLLSMSTDKDHFTSYREIRGEGTAVKLTRGKVTRSIKTAAKAFDLDPIFFSTHSIRITGATRLRAAGATDQTIMRMGRWASITACCLYQRENATERTAVTSILAKGGGFGIEDFRRTIGSKKVSQR